MHRLPFVNDWGKVTQALDAIRVQPKVVESRGRIILSGQIGISSRRRDGSTREASQENIFRPARLGVGTSVEQCLPCFELLRNVSYFYKAPPPGDEKAGEYSTQLTYEATPARHSVCADRSMRGATVRQDEHVVLGPLSPKLVPLLSLKQYDDS